MIEKYRFERKLEGESYGCEIYAESFAEAERIARAANGTNVGKVICQTDICTECFNQLICPECDDLKEGYLPPEIPQYQN